jgi:hypothetical protein
MDSKADLSRRRFLASAASLAAIPLAQLACGNAQAADLPHVAADDPTAKALAYTNDSSSAAKDPMFKAGSHCANCSLFQGKKGDAWGPCGAFPGKSVNANGWCHAWSGAA